VQEPRSVLDNAAMRRMLGICTLHAVRQLQPW
jgi:hypothetical protein